MSSPSNSEQPWVTRLGLSYGPPSDQESKLSKTGISGKTSSNPNKGKVLAKANPTAFAPVTVDHLARLIEAVNKRNVTPAPSGIEHTTGINGAIAADAVTKYQKLGKAIKPKLEENGSNLPVWRSSLVNTVAIVFEQANYFDVKTVDWKINWHIGGKSVHTNLVPDIQGMQGRKSGMVMHVDNITEDLLLPMGLHARCQADYQEITNALDSQLAVDKDRKVLAKHVLELAGRFEAGPAPASLVLAFQLQQHSVRGPRILGGSAGGNSGLVMWRSAEWARRVLNEQNLCWYFWEWGHWRNK
ncbi:hypothetical protein VP01_7g29 [Puccinia sorghi]|uniref:Uncharacterized protein n=1 Tax=Puccinia sorghi TaxID=27349 RepID=A0A0L6UAL8_9BASI|nr:hypothetical protein VP01_7g29 [Puccinia sorghi]